MESGARITHRRFPAGACRLAAVLGAVAFLAAFPFVATSADEALIRESREAMEKADPFMGDWQGTFTQRNKKTFPLAAQVVALGKDKYHATLLPAFDQRTSALATLEGRRDGDTVRFLGWGDVSAYCGPDWEAALEGGKLTGNVPAREGGAFELHKVVRLSPTLGQKPPTGAVALFDGRSFDQWRRQSRFGVGRSKPVAWKIVEGTLECVRGAGSIATIRRFDNFRLHLEFRTPFMPDAREQSRGNSGVIFHGLEIQVLDSYGLGGRNKECGALYDRVAPRVNMCAPPLQWQTYDITFHTPDKNANPRLTVLHNGIRIHDELDTGREGQPSTILLQDHGNPVRYRNIWLVELP